MKGYLFVNENKEHDKQPDFTGTITIGATEYRLGGWDSVSKSGKNYISIIATHKNKQSVQEKIERG